MYQRDVELPCVMCRKDTFVEVPVNIRVKDWACDNEVRCDDCAKIEDCSCGATPDIQKDYSGEWTATCLDCYDYCTIEGASGPRAWGTTLAELAEEWNEEVRTSANP